MIPTKDMRAAFEERLITVSESLSPKEGWSYEDYEAELLFTLFSSGAEWARERMDHDAKIKKIITDVRNKRWPSQK